MRFSEHLSRNVMDWEADHRTIVEDVERRHSEERIRSAAELAGLRERLEAAETQAVREHENRIEQVTQLQHEADENAQGRDAALEQIVALERDRDQIAVQCREDGGRDQGTRVPPDGADRRG